ncbi:MAG: tail fiber domain-containing protein [Saprospiraceae bacterium]
MKNLKFLQLSLLLVLFLVGSITTTQAQWLSDPGYNPVADNDISTDIFRKGNVSIAALNPFPNDIVLHIGGRFSQAFSGSFGGQGSNDRWAALGGNFGTPNVTQTYGLIRQWNGSFFISGVKDGKHGVVSWAGGGRLDFDFVTSTNVNKTRMSILSNGRVGILKTNPQYTLDVNGTAACTGGFWSSSDKRFKKDIASVKTPLEKISQLEGVTYKFKKEKFGEIDFVNSDDRTEYGFLAQDLAKVFPELVRKDKDGYHAVRYEGLIPVLVEGMKEQNDIIASQEELNVTQGRTIEVQKEKIDELENRIDRLENLINNLAQAKETNTRMRSTAVLKQNTPNPYNDLTTIQYELPSDVNNANLVIYGSNGNVLKSFPVIGKGSVEFDAAGLSSGTYVYTIVSNGAVIATQRMVVQR